MACNRPEIHYMGEKLPQYDAVIPRIDASITFYGTAVLHQFEMMNVFPLNESVAISRSRDKLRFMQLLSRKGIRMPLTGFANKPDDVQNLIKMVGNICCYRYTPTSVTLFATIDHKVYSRA